MISKLSISFHNSILLFIVTFLIFYILLSIGSYKSISLSKGNNEKIFNVNNQKNLDFDSNDQKEILNNEIDIDGENDNVKLHYKHDLPFKFKSAKSIVRKPSSLSSISILESNSKSSNNLDNSQDENNNENNKGSEIEKLMKEYRQWYKPELYHLTRLNLSKAMHQLALFYLEPWLPLSSTGKKSGNGNSKMRMEMRKNSIGNIDSNIIENNDKNTNIETGKSKINIDENENISANSKSDDNSDKKNRDGNGNGNSLSVNPSHHIGDGHVPITQRMLNLMEFSYKGGAFRVRIYNGRIYYRKLVYWKQTYRSQRMLWYLRFLYDIVNRKSYFPAIHSSSSSSESSSSSSKSDGNWGDLKNLRLDLVIYVGDGAKVAKDTQTTDSGFPLFSLRTSTNHIDIPIPDPVTFGSNGHYQWSPEEINIDWKGKRGTAVFRGKASCLKMQVDNWHACDRVRLAKLGSIRSDLLNVGLTDWNQLFKSKIYDAPTVEEIERTTGISKGNEMTYSQQSKFKYILDLDGGLGSSRKPGILSSGSMLIAQESPWYGFWEPLFQPYKHYIPIDRHLTNLISQIEFCKSHDDQCMRIRDQGMSFQREWLSLEANKMYMKYLLEEYSKLLVGMAERGDEPVEKDLCNASEEIRKGPMGCSREWLLFNGDSLPDEIINDKEYI